MNTFRILVSLFIVLGVIVVFQSRKTASQKSPENSAKQSIASSPTPQKSLSPTPTVTETPPTPQPTLPPKSSDSDSSLLYPGSVVIENDKTTFALQSTDSPDAITDWYQKKLQTMELSIKTFVKTKTNGNVQNKLVGANSEINISIEIKKSANETITTVEIRTNTT